MNFIGRMLFAPFGAVHPVITILILAVVIGAASLLVFKWTSNQEKIRAAKAPLKAHLLGILLFRHDLRMVFRSLGRALLISVANLRFMFVPLLVMIGPLFLVFVQPIWGWTLPWWTPSRGLEGCVYMRAVFHLRKSS